ncbi:hypothetical protein [Paraburkholderia heleia]
MAEQSMGLRVVCPLAGQLLLLLLLAQILWSARVSMRRAPSS